MTVQFTSFFTTNAINTGPDYYVIIDLGWFQRCHVTSLLFPTILADVVLSRPNFLTFSPTHKIFPTVGSLEDKDDKL